VTAVTIEQSPVETTVMFRAPRRDRIGWWAVAGLNLVVAALLATGGMTWLALCWLVISCVFAAEALWFGIAVVELTPETASLRGFRRRSIPWQDVQDAVRYRRLGAWTVRLGTESGKPALLRVPNSTWGLGGEEYERDFHRIEQWWLDHRGESWRPAWSEAPRLPSQE